jgi:hypothetical protein
MSNRRPVAADRSRAVGGKSARGSPRQTAGSPFNKLYSFGGSRLPLCLTSRFGYTALSLCRLGDEILGAGNRIFSSRCEGRLTAVPGRQPSSFRPQIQESKRFQVDALLACIGLRNAGRSHWSKESKKGQALNPDHRSLSSAVPLPDFSLHRFWRGRVVRWKF